MASEDDPTIFPDDDFDDSLISSSSSSSDDEPPPLHHHPSTTAVTVAITPPPPPPPPQLLLPPPSAAAPDSRRLFQRLWTDEDEIELLQGFLDFTASRGGATASGHYHDTAAFYDQIKNKLQLDFNKSQLVEKLRRLKKKYRTIVSKMSSGNKEFVFKSPHDHATFQISAKIWSHLSPAAFRGGSAVVGGGGGFGAVEIDDDDPNPNPNAVPISSCNPVTIAAAVTPPRPPNSSYVISQINLNSVSPGGGGGGGIGGGGFDMMLTNWGGNGPNGGGLSKLCTRKRSRVATPWKSEEKFAKTEGGIDNSLGSDNANAVNNVGLSAPLQALVEETVRNCLSPVLKDLVSKVVNGTTVADSSGGGGGGSHGFKGVGSLAMNAVPLNFSGVMDEKWRKQQIMELEVYSKRLELVQEQIKLSLEELRSTESEENRG